MQPYRYANNDMDLPALWQAPGQASVLLRKILPAREANISPKTLEVGRDSNRCLCPGTAMLILKLGGRFRLTAAQTGFK